MHRKLLALACLLPVLSLLAFWLLPARKPVYFNYGPKTYKVVKWEIQRGTNIAFATDFRLTQWGRRQLDKIGIHLKGERRDLPYSLTGTDDHTHVIKLLCEGDYPSQEIVLNPSNNDLEYFDSSGQKVLMQGTGTHIAPKGQVWFFWTYEPRTQPNLVPVFDPGTNRTNYCPRGFRILRRSDGKELLSLPPLK